MQTVAKLTPNAKKMTKPHLLTTLVVCLVDKSDGFCRGGVDGTWNKIEVGVF